MDKELLNIVTVGHVDHGKSTVIGRMLADAGALPQGKLEAIRENCRRNSKPFEYAFLLDALKNEQAQGITIDTARCFFKTEQRDYIIIDAPGHIEFLKKPWSPAPPAPRPRSWSSTRRAAWRKNTRRHGYFLSMLGIRQVAVLVNKNGSRRLRPHRVRGHPGRNFSHFLLFRRHHTPRRFIPRSAAWPATTS
jgi:GTPases - Sulfate adenylate transferase subunit 1